jgi:ribonuclease P protein component
MLPKKNRADTKVVEQIFKGGKILNSQSLTFRFIKVESNPKLLTKSTESSYSIQKSLEPRISIIIPKTVSRLATKRNFLRRLGYNALKKYIAQFPAGIVGVLVFKKPIDSVIDIENEIKNVLNKIN